MTIQVDFQARNDIVRANCLFFRYRRNIHVLELKQMQCCESFVRFSIDEKSSPCTPTPNHSRDDVSMPGGSTSGQNAEKRY